MDAFRASLLALLHQVPRRQPRHHRRADALLRVPRAAAAGLQPVHRPAAAQPPVHPGVREVQPAVRQRERGRRRDRRQGRHDLRRELPREGLRVHRPDRQGRGRRPRPDLVDHGDHDPRPGSRPRRHHALEADHRRAGDRAARGAVLHAPHAAPRARRRPGGAAPKTLDELRAYTDKRKAELVDASSSRPRRCALEQMEDRDEAERLRLLRKENAELEFLILRLAELPPATSSRARSSSARRAR